MWNKYSDIITDDIIERKNQFDQLIICGIQYDNMMIYHLDQIWFQAQNLQYDIYMIPWTMISGMISAFILYNYLQIEICYDTIG